MNPGVYTDASLFDQLFGLDEYDYYDSESSAQASPVSQNTGTPIASSCFLPASGADMHTYMNHDYHVERQQVEWDPTHGAQETRPEKTGEPEREDEGDDDVDGLSY
jgi:hypothetical protein